MRMRSSAERRRKWQGGSGAFGVAMAVDRGPVDYVGGDRGEKDLELAEQRRHSAQIKFHSHSTQDAPAPAKEGRKRVSEVGESRAGVAEECSSRSFWRPLLKIAWPKAVWGVKFAAPVTPARDLGLLDILLLANTIGSLPSSSHLSASTLSQAPSNFHINNIICLERIRAAMLYIEAQRLTYSSLIRQDSQYQQLSTNF